MNVIKDNAKLNIVSDYIHDNSTLVSRDLKITYDRAKDIVTNIVKDKINSNEATNPMVIYQGKDQNGDRVERKKKLTDYFKGAASGIIVPSGTVYLSHDKKLSIHSENTEMRVALRSACKKEGFAAEQQGDMKTAAMKETFQKAYKTGNNSITGLFDNKHNIHYCPSSHYSLTSTTASVTSIGNSIGESMVGGNRIYTKPEVVINHITSIINNTDKIKVRKVIDKYNLSVPTVDECMLLILASSRFYWSSAEYEERIRRVLSLTTEEDRCSFAYVNDLYHLRKHNPNLVRLMFKELLEIKDNITDNLKEVMSTIPEDIEILGKSILYDDMLILSQNKEMLSFKDDKHIPTKIKLVSTCLNIKNKLEEYGDIVEAFFATNNLPPNISDIKQVVRKCTVLSDTDSTCSTYQEWTIWYHNRTLPKFNAEEIGLSGLVLLFNYRTLVHSLELFSKRMGIKGKYLSMLAMKNEFYWKVMTFMTKTKHYFADAAIREGNVFKETKLELKGSNLINSKLPASIKKASDAYFIKVNKTITSGNIVNIHEVVKEIADIERSIIAEYKALNSEMMKTETINDHTSYKGGKLGSAYYHVMLWNEVFGPKYGMIENIPLIAIKLKTTMTSNSKTMAFIHSIGDEDIRNRFIKFIEKYPKEKLETLRLPKEIVSGGIPEELEKVIDIRSAVLELCSTFYLILESLGYYKKEDILLSDYY